MSSDSLNGAFVKDHIKYRGFVCIWRSPEYAKCISRLFKLRTALDRLLSIGHDFGRVFFLSYFVFRIPRFSRVWLKGICVQHTNI